ncbi:transposase [Catenulispora sp. GP43]|uniref:IS21 family transposase n=1 Tax=Catenulispora sp. GP43 TaxID=3156263 RepID=UPI003511C8E2
MVDLIELYVHWYAGRSKSELAESLGLDRGTIRKYLAPAEAAGLVPGGEPIGEEAWRARVAEWFPKVADAKLRQVTWPEIAVHRDYIVEQLKAGVTKATIHQRLRDEHGLEAGLTSLKRWIEANLPEEVTRGQVTVWRPEVPAGKEAQIDYGSLGMWTDPVTGKRRRIWAFIMVLASSRHMFVRPVLTMDQASWTAAHVAAFDFFGGAPRRLVPDNLKTGVDRPDLYDPKLNRSYGELGTHYGTLIDPARARKPKDKPRVERQVPYIRDSFWRGREFGSIAEMQAAAITWCLQVAGTRAHRGLDGAMPLAVFTAAEREALIPLPPTRFTLATWSTAKVGPDCHVKVGKALYSVPWRLLGQRVDVRATATMVQVFHGGALVKTHVAATRGKRTDHDDLLLVTWNLTCRVFGSGTVSPVSKESWWAWWCSRRSGQSWADTRERPSGWGSGPTWGGRLARLTPTPEGCRSTSSCANGSEWIRSPRIGRMSRCSSANSPPGPATAERTSYRSIRAPDCRTRRSSSAY